LGLTEQILAIFALRPLTLWVSLLIRDNNSSLDCIVEFFWLGVVEDRDNKDIVVEIEPLDPSEFTERLCTSSVKDNGGVKSAKVEQICIELLPLLPDIDPLPNLSPNLFVKIKSAKSTPSSDKKLK